jgi:hypothetical protein
MKRVCLKLLLVAMTICISVINAYGQDIAIGKSKAIKVSQSDDSRYISEDDLLKNAKPIDDSEKGYQLFDKDGYEIVGESCIITDPKELKKIAKKLDVQPLDGREPLSLTITSYDFDESSLDQTSSESVSTISPQSIFYTVSNMSYRGVVNGNIPIFSDQIMGPFNFTRTVQITVTSSINVSCSVSPGTVFSALIGSSTGTTYSETVTFTETACPNETRVYSIYGRYNYYTYTVTNNLTGTTTPGNAYVAVGYDITWRSY